MARKAYNRYSKEFKVEAVRMAAESDRPVTHVARELGLRQNQIYKWKNELEGKKERAFPGKGKPVCSDPENARLRQELATAREELEVLKKAAAYFARDMR